MMIQKQHCFQLEQTNQCQNCSFGSFYGHKKHYQNLCINNRKSKTLFNRFRKQISGCVLGQTQNGKETKKKHQRISYGHSFSKTYIRAIIQKDCFVAECNKVKNNKATQSSVTKLSANIIDRWIGFFVRLHSTHMIQKRQKLTIIG